MDGGSGAVESHRHDVDTARSGSKTVRRLPHAPLFVPGQLDEGILANPGLDLDGNDATADRHEKVYLTLSAPKVGRHEPRPAAKEKPGGDALAKPA